MNDAKAIDVVVGFVTGDVEVREFEAVLYREAALEAMLSCEPAPPYSSHGVTLFNHLIALDYGDVGAVVDARGLLVKFLTGRGVNVVASNKAREKLRLLHSAQPRWLDADNAILSELLAAAPAAGTQRCG
ncbi:hypothetical protein [Lysobacter sp. FW306-1B-D06B]|uniref:hypothetical protein n=1 Tax=Lysobacter sp. FW306-1B-D06B TaxID=3140250 RepID=UPI00314096A8